MATEISATLLKLQKRIPGFKALYITDEDGVVVEQAIADASLNTQAHMASVFALACEQVTKLGFGNNHMIATFFDNHLVVQINHQPLIITIVASSDSNPGLIMALAPELRSALLPVRDAVLAADAAA
eukprot:TRINITY_DN4336_c0_g1_i1.p1 TRINITY_DN4336_c0_g1~~TRINITY_DN4336_c0_g1_i1.p1  ORF type:complete len:136 (-),score=39.72 TRINITY_DN4336_c0_g1_i1:45-425(-)